MEIDSFTSQFPRRYEVFVSTPILLRAIQMNVAIIGEAMNRILKISDKIKISDARKIVNTRNYLIHGYDSLRPEILWSIVINNHPVLKNEVLKLLDAPSDSDEIS